jgi:hypothetical protein
LLGREFELPAGFVLDDTLTGGDVIGVLLGLSLSLSLGLAFASGTTRGFFLPLTLDVYLSVLLFSERDFALLDDAAGGGGNLVGLSLVICPFFLEGNTFPRLSFKCVIKKHDL